MVLYSLFVSIFMLGEWPPIVLGILRVCQTLKGAGTVGYVRAVVHPDARVRGTRAVIACYVVRDANGSLCGFAGAGHGPGILAGIREPGKRQELSGGPLALPHAEPLCPKRGLREGDREGCDCHGVRR